MIDTLKLANRLAEAAHLPKEQADAIAEEISKALADASPLPRIVFDTYEERRRKRHKTTLWVGGALILMPIVALVGGFLTTHGHLGLGAVIIAAAWAGGMSAFIKGAVWDDD